MININNYQNIIKDYRKDYNFKLESENFELKEIGNILLSKKVYEDFEYRFLSWLIYLEIIPNSKKINLPYFKTIIEPIVNQVFFDKYGLNPVRKDICNSFLNFSEEMKSQIKIQNTEIEFLIGGSFTDIQKENPSDIDFIIKLPQIIWDKLYLENSHELNHINRDYKQSIEDIVRSKTDSQYNSNNYVLTHIDFKALPENFSLNTFKAYNNVIMLMNDALYKDKPKINAYENFRHEYPNNFFTERKVLSVYM
jgi:hypothetical protein